MKHDTRNSPRIRATVVRQLYPFTVTRTGKRFAPSPIAATCSSSSTTAAAGPRGTSVAIIWMEPIQRQCFTPEVVPSTTLFRRNGSRGHTVTINAAEQYQRIAGLGVSEGFGQTKTPMNTPASVQQQVLSLRAASRDWP